MVQVPSKSTTGYSSMAEKACISVEDPRQKERMEALKKDFPNVDFAIAPVGPRSRSIGPTTPSSGDPAADNAAKTANEGIKDCSGNRIIAKPKAATP